MAYLNCGRCGLEIRIQAAYLRVEHCPRCLARSATIAPMTLHRGDVTRGPGGTREPDQHTGPCQPVDRPSARAAEADPSSHKAACTP